MADYDRELMREFTTDLEGEADWLQNAADRLTPLLGGTHLGIGYLADLRLGRDRQQEQANVKRQAAMWLNQAFIKDVND